MTKIPQKTRIWKILLITGVVVLVAILVSAFSFFQSLDHIKRDGWKYPPRSPLGIFVSGEKGPMSVTGSVESIEGWMTFDYVNLMYGLPNEYLKEMLHIEDKKYPHIPISRYAKSIGFSKEDFVGMVRKAVALFNTPTNN